VFVIVGEEIGTRTRQRYPAGLKRILQFEGGEEDVFRVIASEAKQSIARQKQDWIASSLTLLAMTVGMAYAPSTSFCILPP
jgi:hypothetical protein